MTELIKNIIAFFLFCMYFILQIKILLQNINNFDN